MSKYVKKLVNDVEAAMLLVESSTLMVIGHWGDISVISLISLSALSLSLCVCAFLLEFAYHEADEGRHSSATSAIARIQTHRHTDTE